METTPTQARRLARQGRRDVDRDLPGIPAGSDPEWRSRGGVRVLPPRVAAALRGAMRARRWTAAELGRRANISPRFAAYLVAGERAPSVAVAGRLIAVLGLGDDVAADLLEVARPTAGEDSPYRALS